MAENKLVTGVIIPIRKWSYGPLLITAVFGPML